MPIGILRKFAQRSILYFPFNTTRARIWKVTSIYRMGEKMCPYKASICANGVSVTRDRRFQTISSWFSGRRYDIEMKLTIDNAYINWPDNLSLKSCFASGSVSQLGHSTILAAAKLNLYHVKVETDLLKMWRSHVNCKYCLSKCLLLHANLIH